MCLIAFAWKPNPKYLWALVANRDEAHGRLADPLGRWPEASHILAGRDRQARGTWLGISERGRLAVVTNVRESGPSDTVRHSRGMLASDFLTGTETARRRAAILQGRQDDYGPFNVILADDDEAIYTSNRGEPGVQVLQPGVYGLSNGALDTPWPKTQSAKAALSRWLGGGYDANMDLLFAAFADDSRPPDWMLPDTGVGLVRERLVAPLFIRGEEYGTRCTTIMLVEASGAGYAIERRYGPGGLTSGQSRDHFQWPLSTCQVHDRSRRPGISAGPMR